MDSSNRRSDNGNDYYNTPYQYSHPVLGREETGGYEVGYDKSRPSTTNTNTNTNTNAYVEADPEAAPADLQMNGNGNGNGNGDPRHSAVRFEGNNNNSNKEEEEPKENENGAQESAPQNSAARGGNNNNNNLRNSLRRRASVANIPRRYRAWPRTIACCAGVFIPLNMLVFTTLLFGLLFGQLEKAEEFKLNDGVIRSRMADTKYSDDLSNVLSRLPNLCLALLERDEPIEALPYLLEKAVTNQTLLETYLTFDRETQGETVIPGNLTVAGLAEFFAKCGVAGGDFQEKWMGLFTPMVGEDAADLSFNYIRCVNRSSPLAFNFIVNPKTQDLQEARPETQAILYEATWKKNQKELELEYLEEYTEIEALTKSYADATGSGNCAVNMPSAAWFWFTVASTVGYGNQVPKSFGGRIMTYTLGFLSILLFGLVMATTGTITTHLVNDALHRFKKQVPKPVTVLTWGILWILWMFQIAFYVISFQKKRLGYEMTLEDGYWLAFISTTTVGFGDYYLQPEGLFVADLLALWVTFLIGFVLLSSFLTELSNLFGAYVPNIGADLQRKLKYAYDSETPPEEVPRRSRRSSLLNNDDRDANASDDDNDNDGPGTNANTNNTNTAPTTEVPKNNVGHPKDNQDREIDVDHHDDPGKHAHQNHPPQVANSAPAAQEQHAAPAEHQAPAPSSTPPTEKTATFTNTGTDPSMANALLYYEETFMANLGHGEPPLSVATFPGHRWFIVANGVYAKQFTVGEEAHQEFTL